MSLVSNTVSTQDLFYTNPMQHFLGSKYSDKSDSALGGSSQLSQLNSQDIFYSTIPETTTKAESCSSSQANVTSMSPRTKMYYDYMSKQYSLTNLDESSNSQSLSKKIYELPPSQSNGKENSDQYEVSIALRKAIKELQFESSNLREMQKNLDSKQLAIENKEDDRCSKDDIQKLNEGCASIVELINNQNQKMKQMLEHQEKINSILEEDKGKLENEMTGMKKEMARKISILYKAHKKQMAELIQSNERLKKNMSQKLWQTKKDVSEEMQSLSKTIKARKSKNPSNNRIVAELKELKLSVERLLGKVQQNCKAKANKKPSHAGPSKTSNKKAKGKGPNKKRGRPAKKPSPAATTTTTELIQANPSVSGLNIESDGRWFEPIALRTRRKMAERCDDKPKAKKVLIQQQTKSTLEQTMSYEIVVISSESEDEGNDPQESQRKRRQTIFSTTEKATTSYSQVYSAPLALIHRPQDSEKEK